MTPERIAELRAHAEQFVTVHGRDRGTWPDNVLELLDALEVMRKEDDALVVLVEAGAKAADALLKERDAERARSARLLALIGDNGTIGIHNAGCKCPWHSAARAVLRDGGAG